MPYRMHDFMHDFGKFASNPHIKHIAHKLTPITDALISKGTENPPQRWCNDLRHNIGPLGRASPHTNSKAFFYFKIIFVTVKL